MRNEKRYNSVWDMFKEKCIFIVLILFTVMIISLCFQDTINYDEYFSMHWCRMKWKDLIQCLINDVHPPLYYLLLKPIVNLTNGNMLCARLLSAVSGIVSLWSGSLFLEHNFGKESAIFFSCFLFLNPFMIQKVTEIRMYMLASMFTGISGIISYYILKNPKRKYWIIFTVSSLLTAYTHYYALFCMIFLYMGILIYFVFKHVKKEIINWLFCSLATIIGYLMWLPTALKQVASVNNNYWISISPSRLAPLKELFYTMIPYTEYVYLGIVVILTVCLLLLFLKKKLLDDYWALMCVSALWGIFIFTTWYSYKITPILLSRYLIMPICLLFLGISSITRVLNKYIIIIACLFCVLIGGDRYIDSIKAQRNHNTTRTVEFANENFGENDVILYCNVNEDDIYFTNCVTYYFPNTICMPIETVQLNNPEEIVSETNMLSHMETAWLLDTTHSMMENENNMEGFTIEDYGSYGFNTMTFEIYKITYNN